MKYYGASVAAVCAPENESLIKSLGADRVIDYTSEDFTKTDQRYHYVFDTVGKSSFKKCKPLLQTGGVYISSEPGWMAQNLFFSLLTPLTCNKKVKFPFPSNHRRTVLLVRQLCEQGVFKPVIDRIFSFEEIAEAYKYVEKGKKIGNVVITINKKTH